LVVAVRIAPGIITKVLQQPRMATATGDEQQQQG
jgi:hypothetical protein